LADGAEGDGFVGDEVGDDVAAAAFFGVVAFATGAGALSGAKVKVYCAEAGVGEDAVEVAFDDFDGGVGVAEVENSKVLESLLDDKALEDIDYGFVHFDSQDERGIDTALLYHKKHFKVDSAETVEVVVENESGERDWTRDILYVQGRLNGEEVQVFVNHWPSRRDGAELSSPKRERAAQTILQKIKTSDNGGDNCIIMGDFNDDPNSKSIKMLMDSGHFINPMKKLLSWDKGSANYKGKWSLFDQVIISHTFLNHEPNTHMFKKAGIFSPKLVKEWKGKYKGNPFRTYVGKKYLGGYSDHFPVYVILEKK